MKRCGSMTDTTAPVVAPPVEISNQYLPVLGKIAQFCKNPKNLMALDEISSPDEFFRVLEQADV